MAEFARSLIGDACYNSYFVKGNFTDISCFKLLVSKALGWGVVAGAMMVKVPQIKNMIDRQSAAGINLLSTLIELVTVGITVNFSLAKGFPFSTYGETVFLSIQNIITVYLIFLYTRRLNSFVIFLMAYSVYLYALSSRAIVSLEALTLLQSTTIPLFIASRVPQIIENFKTRSTGALSAITWTLNFAGSLARVFTTMQEASDPVLLAGYVIGSVLNGIIMLQVFNYKDTVKKNQ